MYLSVSCNLTVTLWLESIVKIPIPLQSRADRLVWVRDKKVFFFFQSPLWIIKDKGLLLMW